MGCLKASLKRVRNALVTLSLLLTGALLHAAPPDGVLDISHASVKAVMAVQRDVTPGFMSLAGVVGTAVGLDAQDQPALVVYVDKDNANVGTLVKSLPPQLRGVGVKVEMTDKIVAFRRSEEHTSELQSPDQSRMPSSA